MSNEAQNTLARMQAARQSRVSENNPLGLQSDILRTSTNAVLESSKRCDDAEVGLRNAMSRLK